MPDSKRLRKYFELDASTDPVRLGIRCPLAAQTAKSVSFSSRQRAVSEEWCGTPPRSVSSDVAVAGCEEDEELAARPWDPV